MALLIQVWQFGHQFLGPLLYIYIHIWILLHKLKNRMRTKHVYIHKPRERERERERESKSERRRERGGESESKRESFSYPWESYIYDISPYSYICIYVFLYTCMYIYILLYMTLYISHSIRLPSTSPSICCKLHVPYYVILYVHRKFSLVQHHRYMLACPTSPNKVKDFQSLTSAWTPAPPWALAKP